MFRCIIEGCDGRIDMPGEACGECVEQLADMHHASAAKLAPMQTLNAASMDDLLAEQGAGLGAC